MTYLLMIIIIIVFIFFTNRYKNNVRCVKTIFLCARTFSVVADYLLSKVCYLVLPPP